jgi:CO/xanthine dehydrogenase FAD-binding subunit
LTIIIGNHSESKMGQFQYIRASTVKEAVDLLNEPGLKSRPLAGGTDILLQLRHDPHYCDRLVDISKIPDLHLIEQKDEWVNIGAAATFNEVLKSPIIKATARVLEQACISVGAVQIRNMGTLGGNVANAAACADSLPALICMDVVARFLTPAGEQQLPVTQLVSAPNKTILPPGALLISLRYPVPAPGCHSAFLKLGRRNAMAISRLTVAALGCLDEKNHIVEARLVTGSATPHIERLTTVEQALIGKQPSPELFHSAAKQTVDEMVRLAGYRWSSEFKVPALTAMTERVLAQVFKGNEKL